MMQEKISKTNLGSLSTLLSGHPFRGRIEHDPAGEFALVQLRSVDQEVGVLVDKLIRVTPGGRKNPDLLEVGDILFVNRGMRLFAVHIDKALGRAIAAPHFFIIRANTSRILPSYLSWYLNHKRAQLHLVSRAAGTALPHVTRKTLSGLPVDLPSLERQEYIVKAYECWLRERSLLEKLKVNRERLVSSVLDTALNAE